MLPFSREGLPTLFIVTAVSAGILAGSWFFFPSFFYFLLIPCIIIELIVINFFRDPERIPPPGDNLIVAPADGKIIKVQNVSGDRYMGQDAKLVCIFMNPFNVHVNRNPVSGTVTQVERIKGRFLSAYKDEAPIQNEQAVIAVDSAYGRIIFKQIAGFVARRVVCNLNPGQKVSRGERMGIIKFGSRVDILLPLNSEIHVKTGDRVKAGMTVIAAINHEG